MVNDLTDTNLKKNKLPLPTSKSLTHVTDNPLEDFSDKEDFSNNQTNSIIIPTGITSLHLSIQYVQIDFR